MNRLLSRVSAGMLAFVCIFLVIAVGFAWYNNTCMAWQWIRCMVLQWDTPKEAYSGPLPWLNWAGVDFSTATTFIPFFSLSLIAIGFMRIAAAEKGKLPRGYEYFPFFKSHNYFIVTLGLIGTVWGLIMIGYYDPETVGMKDLILGMKTALFSTLIALMWVFFISMPANFLMKAWHVHVSGAELTKKVSMPAILSELSAAVLGATETFRQADAEIGKLSDTAKKAAAGLWGITETLATMGFDKTLKAMMEESDARAKMMAEVKKTLEEMNKVLKDVRAVAEKAEVSARKAAEDREKAITERVEAVAEKRQAEKRLKESAAILNRLGKMFRKARVALGDNVLETEGGDKQ